MYKGCNYKHASSNLFSLSFLKGCRVIRKVISACINNLFWIFLNSQIFKCMCIAKHPTQTLCLSCNILLNNNYNLWNRVNCIIVISWIIKFLFSYNINTFSSCKSYVEKYYYHHPIKPTVYSVTRGYLKNDFNSDFNDSIILTFYQSKVT